MAHIDYDGTGEREILATGYTTVIYEQEFKRDIIKDVFGRVDTRPNRENLDEDGNVAVLDFTLTDWNAMLRALWALLRTAYEVARRNGEKCERVGSFGEWVASVGPMNLPEVTNAVTNECVRGFFRTGAAASEE